VFQQQIPSRQVTIENQLIAVMKFAAVTEVMPLRTRTPERSVTHGVERSIPGTPYRKRVEVKDMRRKRKYAITTIGFSRNQNMCPFVFPFARLYRGSASTFQENRPVISFLSLC
jgi:hypothetical protein